MKDTDIISLIKYIDDNGLLYDGNAVDTRIIALLSSLTRNPNNKRHWEMFLRILTPKMISRTITGDILIPYSEIGGLDGPIRLGKCGEMPVGLYQQELMEGIVVVGRPGAGKTNLNYHLIENANAQGIHCLILDIKLDYRHIIRKVPNTLVFRCGMDPDLFRWNPLACPSGSLSNLTGWITTFSDITAEAHTVYDGTSNYMADHLYKLYKRFGVFDGSNNYPNLWDLFWEIKNDKQSLIKRDARYKESALNRIQAVLIKMGKAFNCTVGYPIHELIEEHNVVIELDNLGKKGKIYMLALIIGYVIFYRISNNLRGNLARPVMILVDEGNEVFDKTLEQKQGTLTISSLTREAREFNLGVVCSCHLFQHLSDSVKNVHTRILMSVGDGDNLRKAQISMGINSEERDVNYELNKGEAIVRKAERCTKPFRCQPPLYPIVKDVAIDEVKEHMKQFSSLLTFKLREKKNKKDDSESGELTSEQKSCLFDLFNRPYLNKEQRIKSMDISTSKFYSMVNSLKRKNFVEEYSVNLGGRGGKTSFLNISKDGCDAIGVKSKPHLTRGGNFITDIFVYKTVENLKKIVHGCKISIEKEMQGKFTDIVIEMNDSFTIAVEVELSAVNLDCNMQKDSERAGFVIEACIDQQVLSKAKEIKMTIPRERQNRIGICLLSKLLKCSTKLGDLIDSEILKEKGL